MAYVPDREKDLTAQVRNGIESLIGLVYATGTITMTDNPANEGSVTISDGVTAIEYIFLTALTGAPAAGTVEVLIDVGEVETMALLIDAINGSLIGVAESAGVVASYDTDHVALVNRRPGTLGNVAITDAATNTTVTGMAGGCGAKAVTMRESDLQAIYDGYSFHAGYSVTTAATDEHRSAIIFKTPATSPYVSITASFTASTAATAFIYEAPTTAVDIGTDSVIQNRNRISTITSAVETIETAPEAGKVTTLTEAQIAADGTWANGLLLITEVLSAGAGPKPAGGSSPSTQGWVLAPATKYVFIIQNTAASANDHHIDLSWTENCIG